MASSHSLTLSRKRIFYVTAGIRTQDYSSRRLVTIPTTLSRFQYRRTRSEISFGKLRIESRKYIDHHLDNIAKQICFGDDSSALHSKGTRFETIHGDIVSSCEA